jgi:hypothetical protein
MSESPPAPASTLEIDDHAKAPTPEFLESDSASEPSRPPEHEPAPLSPAQQKLFQELSDDDLEDEDDFLDSTRADEDDEFDIGPLPLPEERVAQPVVAGVSSSHVGGSRDSAAGEVEGASVRTSPDSDNRPRYRPDAQAGGSQVDARDARDMYRKSSVQAEMPEEEKETINERQNVHDESLEEGQLEEDNDDEGIGSIFGGPAFFASRGSGAASRNRRAETIAAFTKTQQKPLPKPASKPSFLAFDAFAMDHDDSEPQASVTQKPAPSASRPSAPQSASSARDSLDDEDFDF